MVPKVFRRDEIVLLSKATAGCENCRKQTLPLIVFQVGRVEMKTQFGQCSIRIMSILSIVLKPYHKLQLLVGTVNRLLTKRFKSTSQYKKLYFNGF